MTKITPAIRNITVSGRIASGSTTLAKGLQQTLNWSLLEGGKLFENFHKSINTSESEVTTRPDNVDLEYEETVKMLLTEKSHQIIQSHLAGFDAQSIPGVFKILVICQDKNNKDVASERIKRLIERKGVSAEEATKEAKEREEGNLKKWRRLYAQGDQNWVYWDKKYYDLVINTYFLNQQEALKKALSALKKA